MPLLIGSAFIIVLLYGLQSWVPTFLHRIHGWEHTRIGDQYGLVALFAGSLGVISGPVFERYLTKLNFNPPIIIVMYHYFSCLNNNWSNNIFKFKF